MARRRTLRVTSGPATARNGDFFPRAAVIRDADFTWTMFPATPLPGSLCYALSEAVVDRINKNTNVKAVITNKSMACRIAEDKGIVVSEKAELDYYQLHNRLVDSRQMPLLVSGRYISQDACIDPSAYIGRNVHIEDGVEISAFAYIADNSIIGANTFIGPHAVIGARGMQCLKIDGKSFNIRYAGGVRLGSNCEVLAHAVVQKPYQPFFTDIGDNTKISVRANVGHGCRIGKNSMIAGNVTIAGNVCTGDNIWIGPSSTVADGLSIGENVRIILGSVVVNHIGDDQTVSGNFAIEHQKHLKHLARIRKL
jgi:UDP-3-O-[3-hydroxymyristoyl] glucosamine N-acyltransferase